MDIETIVLINGPLCALVGLLLGLFLFTRRVLDFPAWHRAPFGIFVAVMVMRGLQYSIKAGLLSEHYMPEELTTVWITPLSDFFLALAFLWILVSYAVITIHAKRNPHVPSTKSSRS